MSASSLLPDAVALHRRLARVRRRGRLVVMSRGMSLLLAALALAVVTVAMLDWRWHLPGMVRAVALVATLAAAGIIGNSRLLAPLRRPSDDLSLALRIEEAYPSLNDSLGSAVEFLQQRARLESPVMRREAVRRALKQASGCDFGRIIDRRGLGAAGLAMLATCSIAGVLVWLDPARAATALVRLADPFGAHDWPRQTQIELEPPRTRIGRNEPFEVRGWVRGVLPERATVVFRFDSAPQLEHECDVIRGGSAPGRLATRLDAGRIQRSFRFQVFANDAATDEIEVQVLPPPVLVPLDGKASPQVHIWPPAYTDLPSPQDLPAGSGNIEAVAGTQALLRAAVDRPLRAAWIEFLPDNRLSSLAAFLAPLGARQSPAAVGLAAMSRSAWETVPAHLEPDRQTLSVAFYPRTAGLYVLHFEDETGLANSRIFELRLRPDPSPAVQLERPSPSRDVLAVLPEATLPLNIVAEDPMFALRSVYLAYRTGKEQPTRNMAIFDQAKWLGQVGPLLGLGGKAVPWRLRPARLKFHRSLALKTIKHPDGSSLKDGDVLTLQAAADDFDDVTVNKEPGRSHEVEIRIVGRTAIELILNQKQAEIQQDLLRLREKQREALDKVAQAEREFKRNERLNEDHRNKLVEAEQLQQQIRDRVGTPQEGLRAEVDRVLDILRQNDVRDSAARERMKEVGGELERLADKELEPIGPRLTAARKQAELLDEKARVERKGQLEAQGRETEQRSRSAEQAAKTRAKEAAEADQRAGKATDPTARAREEAEAKRLRRQAEELRQRARELAQQAARERREANEPPRKDRPAEELADARRHQEEVERTLNDLLNRLEPWSSLREIKGEAGRVLQDQKQLQGQVDELQNKNFPRDEPSRLEPGEREKLVDLKTAQQRLEERTRQLLDKMKRLAEERSAKDPDAAQQLQAALEKATQGDVAGQMKTAREQIQANRLGQASRAQQKSAEELNNVIKALEDRREAELERLAKKLRQAEDRLAELAREQEDLQKKIKEAGNIADAAKRQQELKKLARKQEKLREEARDMVKELSRLRARDAGQSLAQADGEMARAGQRLREGQKPDNEDEMLDRLDDARREARKAREETEEKLAREQMARVADALLRLRDRQQSLVAEASRIQSEVLRRGTPVTDKQGWIHWPRDLAIGSWKRLREAQAGLVHEASAIASKDLADTPVFRRLLVKAVEAMMDAGKRMEALGKPAKADTLPDAEADKLQQLALRRLEQLALALKPDDEGGRMARVAGGQGDGEGGDSGGDDLPSLGQLKLLRALQAEVNARTEAFHKKHPKLDRLEPKEKAELESIRRDQKEVAELLEELMRPAGEMDEKDGGRQ